MICFSAVQSNIYGSGIPDCYLTRRINEQGEDKSSHAVDKIATLLMPMALKIFHHKLRLLF